MVKFTNSQVFSSFKSLFTLGSIYVCMCLFVLMFLYWLVLVMLLAVVLLIICVTPVVYRHTQRYVVGSLYVRTQKPRDKDIVSLQIYISLTCVSLYFSKHQHLLCTFISWSGVQSNVLNV